MLETFQAELIALVQVIVIDLVLAGDNAIVVGMAASRVAPEHRSRVIFWGIAAAVGLRIAFAAVTLQLLAIIGLTLAGGILLLWVCWKMYREIATSAATCLGRRGSGGLRRAGCRTAQHVECGDPDHRRRRVHVARQCAGCRGGREGARLGAGCGLGRCRGADGGRRQPTLRAC